MFSGFVRAASGDRITPRPLGRFARRASGVIELQGRDPKDVLADSLGDEYGL